MLGNYGYCLINKLLLFNKNSYKVVVMLLQLINLPFCLCPVAGSKAVAD